MKTVNKAKKKKSQYSSTTILFILSCTVIPVVSWLIFYVYANLSSILMGFTDRNGVLSLENFIRFFEEFSLPTSDIRLALKNTLITFAVMFVMYPFQVLVSYFLYKKIPFSGFYRIVFFLPSIIFSVAIAMVFRRMVDVNGFIAQTVGKLMNLDYVPELLADSRFAHITVLVNMIWLTFPGNLVIWGGAFARIPEEVLESARIDGVTWWKEFTRIIVPLVWPTVALQMLLLFCGLFGSTGQVFLLTNGDHGTVNLYTWMYLQLYENSGSRYTSNVYNYMSAVGTLTTAVAIAISFFVRKFTDKAFDEVEF